MGEVGGRLLRFPGASESETVHGLAFANRGYGLQRLLRLCARGRTVIRSIGPSERADCVAASNPHHSLGDDPFKEEAVRLSVPTSLEYVRIVRLTASGVASRLGFDVDEIENLRVAVDELASMVADAAAPGRLDVAFWTNGGELLIEGTAPIAPGTDLGIDDLSGQILKAVCDDYSLSVHDGVAEFRCVRRYPA